METRGARRIPQINSDTVGPQGDVRFLFNGVEQSQGAEFEKGKKQGHSGLAK